MIDNKIIENNRDASIARLDETLLNFKSEYHFLFSILNRFVTQGEGDQAAFYIVPNIARRFLEIYVNFKIPTTGDLRGRIKHLTDSIDDVTDVERESVYRLINEFSHSSNLMGATKHMNRTEVQEAVRILLKIVKESDREHFEGLEEAVCNH